MTVITTRDFRANQSKYIKMAQRGEKVVLTSRLGNVQLTPVPNEDAAFYDYVNSETFQGVAETVHREYGEGKYVSMSNREEIEKWFDSL